MKIRLICIGLLGVLMYSSPSISRQSIELAGGELEYTGYIRNETRYGISNEVDEVTQNILRLQLEASWLAEDFGIFDEFSIILLFTNLLFTLDNSYLDWITG